jgi:hypothetical protein
MPATRTNRYDGSCNSCGGRVPAGLGTCERSGSHWLIRHQPGDCSAPGQVINRPAPAAASSSTLTAATGAGSTTAAATSPS